MSIRITHLKRFLPGLDDRARRRLRHRTHGERTGERMGRARRRGPRTLPRAEPHRRRAPPRRHTDRAPPRPRPRLATHPRRPPGRRLPRGYLRPARLTPGRHHHPPLRQTRIHPRGPRGGRFAPSNRPGRRSGKTLARPPQHPGRRRHRIRQDDDAERPHLSPGPGRAHRLHRRHARTPDPPTQQPFASKPANSANPPPPSAAW